MPYRIAAPMTEVLSWKTDLIESHEGSEQAIRVRAAPRQSLEFEIPVARGRHAHSFNQFYGSIGLKWAVPLWFEFQDVGSLTAGATEIPAVLDYYDFRDDSLAILWASEDEWELVEIEAVGSGVLDIYGTLANSYSSAKLVPVRVGRIAPSAARLVSRPHSRLTVHFESDDNVALEAPAAEQQYLDLDVYNVCPKLEGQYVSDQLVTRADTVDTELGVVVDFNPWTHNRRVRSHRVFMNGPEQVWDHRLWLHRRAGRFRQFWWPSFEQDFTLVSSGALGASISVSDPDYLEHASSRTHIAVVLNDGTILPRAITNAVADGGNVILTLSESLDVDSSVVDRISYLGLNRLDSDRVELHWIGGGRCESSVPVAEVEP